ncbi:hypothetical protein BGW41_007721 [Actinomortierella wolfii]|nr:hypothetical protein BGW41_007721 [Actinomortierella wolfii]
MRNIDDHYNHAKQQSTSGYFSASRTAHCVATNNEGTLVAVFGGFVNHSTVADPTVYLLDTNTWTWTAVPMTNMRGRAYSACAIQDNQLIVWGGFFSRPTKSPNNLPLVEESTMVFSMTTRQWVSSFIPSGPSGSLAGVGGGGYSGSGEIGSSPEATSTRSIAMILAIAAAGTLMTLLLTFSIVIFIRKRSLKRQQLRARYNINSNSSRKKNSDCTNSNSHIGTSLTTSSSQVTLTSSSFPPSNSTSKNVNVSTIASTTRTSIFEPSTETDLEKSAFSHYSPGKSMPPDSADSLGYYPISLEREYNRHTSTGR